jgi:restriction system protein
MARRRSLFEQILAERRKAKAAREREDRRLQAQLVRSARAVRAANQRAVAAEEAQLARQAREAQRQTADRAREAERAAKRAESQRRRDEQDAARAAAAEVARQRREQADHARAERETARADRERARTELIDDVAAQNETLRLRVAELDGVLSGRVRDGLIPAMELERVLSSEGPEGFAARVQEMLLTSEYPLGVPSAVRVLAYRPEARELIIERELPRDGVIPAESEVRIIKGEARGVPRKPAQARHQYGQLLARTALRTLAEVFTATPATLVDGVVLNGRVTAVDRATGKVINPHLLSVQFERQAFDDLHLDAPELDPELCLRAQNALISPHPHDLVPIKPLMYYDLDRFKTIAGADFLVDLDSRLDLLTLRPDEFEKLIKKLFEARGLKSWQTVASRDEGVDAVAVNEDPVLGGLAVIQAKRYSHIVGYESVTALAGVMHDKAAAKGILVTTSWVGKASRDLAQRTGRMQIIEGRELKHMLAESLNMDVLISLPVLPSGWDRAQIA